MVDILFLIKFLIFLFSPVLAEFPARLHALACGGIPRILAQTKVCYYHISYRFSEL